MLATLGTVEADLSRQRGRFELFGLFRRRRAGTWDLIVAARWVDPGLRPTIELLIAEIERVVGQPALTASRVISRMIVNPDPRFVDAVHEAVTVEHGLGVVGPGDYGTVEVARGYVITSQPANVIAPWAGATCSASAPPAPR